MKIFTGRVVAQKMAKTATVEVVSLKSHPLYLKRIKKSKRYLVHDELGAKVGEMVKFVASRPRSKSKKWTLTKIVGKKA